MRHAEFTLPGGAGNGAAGAAAGGALGAQVTMQRISEVSFYQLPPTSNLGPVMLLRQYQ